MNTSSPPAQPQHFQSSNVRAGNYALKELGFDVRGLINQLLTGTLETPHGVLNFTAASGGRYGTSFEPFHPDRIAELSGQINGLTSDGRRDRRHS